MTFLADRGFCAAAVRFFVIAVFFAMTAASVSCGKKAPPQPPEELPAAAPPVAPAATENIVIEPALEPVKEAPVKEVPAGTPN